MRSTNRRRVDEPLATQTGVSHVRAGRTPSIKDNAPTLCVALFAAAPALQQLRRCLDSAFLLFL